MTQLGGVLASQSGLQQDGLLAPGRKEDERGYMRHQTGGEEVQVLVRHQGLEGMVNSKHASKTDPL